MGNEADLRAIQRRQLGLITRAQVTGAGATRKVIDRRVQSGAWVRVLPGVYRDALVPETLEQSSLAAL